MLTDEEEPKPTTRASRAFTSKAAAAAVLTDDEEPVSTTHASRAFMAKAAASALTEDDEEPKAVTRKRSSQTLEKKSVAKKQRQSPSPKHADPPVEDVLLVSTPPPAKKLAAESKFSASKPRPIFLASSGGLKQTTSGPLKSTLSGGFSSGSSASSHSKRV